MDQGARMVGRLGFWFRTLALALLGLSLGAELPHLTYQVYRTLEGLPRAYVTSLHLARTGYLWSGSEDGLMRFDGTRFVRHRTSNHPALTSDTIFGLAEGRNGHVYALAQGGGVTRFSPSGHASLRIAPGEGQHVFGVLEDAQGTVWVLTPVGLKGYREGQPPRTAQVPSNLLPLLGGLVEDSKGRIWLGTRAGLARLEGDQVVPVPSEAGPVFLMHPARDGGLWTYQNGAILHHDRDFRPVERIQEGLGGEHIWALHEDAQGTLWVGQRSGLLVVRHGKVQGKLTRDKGLPDEWITALSSDPEGNLWIGTAQAGLVRARATQVPVLGREAGLPHDATYAVAETTDGSRWIGTSKGLVRMKEGKPTTVPGFSGGRASVLSLAADARGGLWIGTEQGVAYLQGSRVDWHTEDGLGGIMTLSLKVDRKGGVWAGTDLGLYRRVDGIFQRQAAPQGLPARFGRVHDIEEDAEGRIWFGALRVGLFCWDGNRYAQAPAGGPPSDREPGAMLADGNALWVGTYGGGLWRHQGGKWTAYTEAQGFPRDFVYGLTLDGLGSLWVGGGGGLYQISVQDLQTVAEGKASRIRPVSWGTPEGLRDPEVACGTGSTALRTSDGQVWFATLSGVAMVDPRRPKPAAPPNPVHIERVLVDGKEVPLGEALSFAPRAGRIVVQYGGVNFSSPERQTFRYRLTGFDPDWVPAGQTREAQYTNLPPGTYQFQVQVSTTCEWLHQGATLAFTVRPALWQRAWFLPGLGLVALALGYGAFRLRMRRLQAREQELKHAVEEALAQVKTLSGLLPICAWCKKVRSDDGYWTQIEAYVAERSEATFSHGMCPDCRDEWTQGAHPKLGEPNAFALEPQENGVALTRE